MTERVIHHFRSRSGELLIADPNSAKAIYGHHFPEYMDETNKDFLREGLASLGPNLGLALIFQLTQPSPGIEMLGDYGMVGSGFMAVEMKVPWEDGYRQSCIHQSTITWSK